VNRTAPDFWWRSDTAGAAVALWPVARLWGAAATRRLMRPPRFRPPVPVICVGNFVVGGAGKTPAVIALVRIARGRGLKPGILARGYGGRVKGPIVVDPAIYNADHVGDEALLLAAAAPTVVARDRVAGARKLIDEGVDAIVMDDGFQDPALAKDLSLVALDAGVGIGNGLTIPSGPLRAPLQSQLQRVDALLVVGDGDASEPVIRAAARAGRPIVKARIKPVRVREWRKQPVLAFAGIGSPAKFFASLNEVGAPVARTVSYPDHYRYGVADAAHLIASADRDGLRLVTTEKDMVRLAGKTGRLADLARRADAFRVTLEFDNPVAIGEMIDAVVVKAALA